MTISRYLNQYFTDRFGIVMPRSNMMLLICLFSMVLSAIFAPIWELIVMTANEVGSIAYAVKDNKILGPTLYDE